MTQACRIGVKMSSRLSYIGNPQEAGASRTCQPGRHTLAGRKATPRSFRNPLFCNVTHCADHLPSCGPVGLGATSSPRSGAMLPVRIQRPALNARWQADEVLADEGPQVVSAVMASVWCNGILKVAAGRTVGGTLPGLGRLRRSSVKPESPEPANERNQESMFAISTLGTDRTVGSGA
jgi:hypothetical protein